MEKSTFQLIRNCALLFLAECVGLVVSTPGLEGKVLGLSDGRAGFFLESAAMQTIHTYKVLKYRPKNTNLEKLHPVLVQQLNFQGNIVECRILEGLNFLGQQYWGYRVPLFTLLCTIHMQENREFYQYSYFYNT